jgi:hypothetical protein
MQYILATSDQLGYVCSLRILQNLRQWFCFLVMEFSTAWFLLFVLPALAHAAAAGNSCVRIITTCELFQRLILHHSAHSLQGFPQTNFTILVTKSTKRLCPLIGQSKNQPLHPAACIDRWPTEMSRTQSGPWLHCPIAHSPSRAAVTWPLVGLRTSRTASQLI